VCALVVAAVTAAAAAASPTPAPAAIVTATLTSHGPVIAGPHTWRPGAARIAVVSQVPDEELTLLHFRPGYSYTRFLADGAHANGHDATARAALRRIFAETIFQGGVDLFTGQSASFTVTVHPGTYYLAQLNRRPNLIAIHVSGPAGAGAPSSGGLVTASDTGYRLDRQAFPAHGTITVRNTGTQQHRLSFVPIKRGTTRAQLAAYLRKTGASDNAPPPPFARKGPQLGTAAISPAQQMQLNYSLPPGEYALIDFGQDPSNGKPDSLEGLCTVATLR